VPGCACKGQEPRQEVAQGVEGSDGVMPHGQPKHLQAVCSAGLKSRAG
jgi:hypothetical protein